MIAFTFGSACGSEGISVPAADWGAAKSLLGSSILTLIHKEELGFVEPDCMVTTSDLIGDQWVQTRVVRFKPGSPAAIAGKTSVCGLLDGSTSYAAAAVPGNVPPPPSHVVPPSADHATHMWYAQLGSD